MIDATTDIPIAEELADIIMGLQRCLIAHLSNQLSVANISVPQFTLLGFLSQTSAISMSQLASKMNHTTPATTGLVDRLVDAKLAKRFEDPEDRRKVMVKITSLGKEVVDRMKQDMVTNILQIFKYIGPEDQQAWLRIYRKIHAFYQSHDCAH